MLAFGRALMSEPKLLILDEPSLGLAPKIVQGMFDLVAELRDEGLSIFMTEQNAREALKVADYAYLLEVSLREPDVLRRLRDKTAGMAKARMQISPEQGQFMALLVELMGARNTLEIGTFTGYSALAVALALPDDGRLVTCDVSEEWTAIARRYWEEAGVAHKIDLRLAPALETLDDLLAEGCGGTFDFVFIDADKENYVNYWEAVLPKLRQGGLIAVDNVLWSGRVLDPKDTLDHAVVAFNRHVRYDDRVELVMLTVRDGVTLARKK